ncbi:MAG TPA: VCBS repeat-containing protein, partial [Myxococcota bacterium]|nr:VCBS repeat-containing protein [Myxococcota bacterium]
MTRSFAAAVIALALALSASPSRGGIRAENAAQGLDASISSEGARITACPSSPAPLEVGLRLAQIARSGESLVPRASEARAVGSRAEIHYPALDLTEWWKSDPRGLEQGFTLGRVPLAGAGPLELSLAVSGATAEASSDHVSFESAGCPGGLALSELHAWDANGTPLDVRLEASAQRIAFVVDDSHAVYPITIDPLASTPVTTDAGVPPGEMEAVSTLGDFNGDGYSDMAVGHGGPIVDVFLGSATGLHTTPDFTITTCGDNVAAAGDVNGDGYDDLLVGYTQGGYGVACLYFGDARGGLTLGWSVISDSATGGYLPFFGARVAGVGDLNGDGYDDFAVSAFEANGAGGVYVWLGSASFGSSSAVTPATANWTGVGDANNLLFGRSVAAAGDTNGDGFDDLVIGVEGHMSGSAQVGGAVVYFGGASFASRPTGTVANADRLMEGNDANAAIGRSVAGAGDVNGDGLADVVTSGPAAAMLFAGNSTLPFGAIWAIGLPSIGPIGESTLAEHTVATAGDV